MPLPSKSSSGLKILVIEVENDLRNIEAVALGLTRAWNNSRQQTLNELEINGVAHLLENFYTAIEDLFLRVARAVDRDVPAGDQWHRDLLQRMAYDIPQVRPAIISTDLAAVLDEYRRFRHRARHVYAPPVPEWDKFGHLAAEAQNTYASLEECMQNWLQFISAASEKLPKD